MSNTKDNWITQEQVDNACFNITQRGERVSTTAVHKELGERGSFSSLQKKIKIWQAQHSEIAEAAENLPLKVDVPEALQETGLNALKAFYQQARQHAQDEVEVMRESLKRTEAEIKEQIAEISAFSENQTETIENLRASLENVNSEKTALEAAQTALNADLSQCRDDLKASQHKIESMEALAREHQSHHETELERNASEKAALQAQLSTQTEKMAKLELQIQAQQTTLDTGALRLDEIKAEKAAAITAEKQALESAAALRGQNKMLLSQAKELDVKLKAERKEAAAAEKTALENAATLRGQNEVLNKDIKKLEAKIKALEKPRKATATKPRAAAQTDK